MKYTTKQKQAVISRLLQYEFMILSGEMCLGGRVPNFVSCYSEDCKKEKPKKIENEFIKNIITKQKKQKHV